MVQRSVSRPRPAVSGRDSPEVETDQFHVAMVHDLKAPVRTARQLLGLLEKRRTDGSNDDDLWGALSQTLVTLEGRVAAILRFSAAGNAGLERRRVDARAIAQAAAAQVQQDIGARVAIRIDDLPQCRGDAALLEQVFYNLIDNAVKYGHGGKVVVGGSKGSRSVAYWVHDDGPGIPAEMASVVFEPFRRGPGSFDVDGHGLGLAIVQRIVARHRGRVEVAGGPGTTVRVILPDAPAGAS